MLTVRIQAIDGAGTFTLPDFQPCRLLIPCSDDFAPGRGGLLQLLSMSLSPCCRFHPAEVNIRIGQSSAAHAAFALQLKARPSGILIFEATTRSPLFTRLCENPIDAMIPLLNRGGMMKGFVQGADRQQTTLLPECLDDWVDESNPVRAVDVFVDAL